MATLQVRKKPKFERQDSYKKKEVKPNWRRARGLQSKVRLSKKGHPRSPKVGYGANKLLYGKNKDGNTIVIIHSLKDLQTGVKETTYLVSSALGNRKRLDILTQALEKDIPIANLKDTAKWKEHILTKQAAEKDRRKKASERTDKKKKESKRKLEEKLTDKETLDKEKKEKDKALIKPK